MCPYPCGFITEFDNDCRAFVSYCRVHISNTKEIIKVERQRHLDVLKVWATLRYASLMYRIAINITYGHI